MNTQNNSKEAQQFDNNQSAFCKKVVFRKDEYVTLRFLTDNDVYQMVDWLNDPEVIQYVSINYPLSFQEEMDYISRHKNGDKDKTEFVFAIETPDGKYIGNIGLHKVDYINRTAITGAIIGDKKYWGKGYGTAAKMLLLEFAFNNLNLRKICSSAIAFNERSIAYQKKTGYVVEGVRKQQIFKNGQYHDEVLLAVFKEDWQKVYEKNKTHIT